MITVELTKGYKCIIDDIDSDLVNYPWFVQFFGGRLPYASRNQNVKFEGVMHIHIMLRILGRPMEEWERVDHKDHDSLNNTRDNLRIATHQQNQFNRTKHITNTSGYKGVSFYKRDGLWQANITVNRKQKFLGLFKTPEEAHEAYKKAAIELHGEFARWE